MRHFPLWLLALTGCLNSGSAPGLPELRERHAEAVVAIKASGGTVEEKKYPPGTGHAVSLKGVSIADEDVEQLRRITGLAELDLSGSTITDDQLAKLVEADEDGRRPIALLFRINLSETPVSDVGLRELLALNLLANVNVKGSQVTPAGIKEFELLCAKRKRPYGLKFVLEK